VGMASAIPRAMVVSAAMLVCAVTSEAFLLSPVATLGRAKPFSRGVRMTATSSTSSASVIRESRDAKEMRYNKLGDSDLLVSEACLGTMTWGKQNSEEEAMRQLDIAFKEYGVNFIDTAEGYPIPLQPETSGLTDKMIGKWMKNQKREDVILAAKVSGASRRLTWLRDDNKGTRVSREQIFESVDKSLARLQTDYIDLLQIHWPDRYVPLFGPNQYDYNMERAAISFEEQLEAMGELVKQGKIRHWGLSNETPFGVMAFVSLALEKGLPKPVSIQNSYSLLTREFESGLAEVCSPSHTNTALIAYSPLSAGVLSGKYDLKVREHQFSTSSEAEKSVVAPFQGNDPNCRLNLLKGYKQRYEASQAPNAVLEYSKIAAKHGMSTVELALSFAASRPFVPSTIVGATNEAQLKENLNAFSREFTEEMLEDIAEINIRYPDPWRTAQRGGG